MISALTTRTPGIFSGRGEIAGVALDWRPFAAMLTLTDPTGKTAQMNLTPQRIEAMRLALSTRRLAEWTARITTLTIYVSPKQCRLVIGDCAVTLSRADCTKLADLVFDCWDDLKQLWPDNSRSAVHGSWLG